MVDIRSQGKVVDRTRDYAEVDEGLRSHMLRVYNYMMVGLALTGVVAFAVANVPELRDVFYSAKIVEGVEVIGPNMLGWIAMFAPLGLVFLLSARINRMSFSSAQTVFWAFAVLFGVSLAHILWTFTGISVARVFFITSAAFGGLSLYGYTTKRDLSGWRSFLVMGLIGVIIAMVVNIFLASAALQFAISVIGVLVFAGLTAYDTQKIKEMYAAADDSELAGKKAIMGALRLYLDFVNMFLMLLYLFGNRE